mmetsp:Transcript_44913/g.81994  ORF Transcript_44913/g.81994 Transcript_44913/m.81994 type:complete len:305 (-) Transcript_44913:686-1600(-)
MLLAAAGYMGELLHAFCQSLPRCPQRLLHGLSSADFADQGTPHHLAGSPSFYIVVTLYLHQSHGRSILPFQIYYSTFVVCGVPYSIHAGIEFGHVAVNVALHTFQAEPCKEGICLLLRHWIPTAIQNGNVLQMQSIDGEDVLMIGIIAFNHDREVARVDFLPQLEGTFINHRSHDLIHLVHYLQRYILKVLSIFGHRKELRDIDAQLPDLARVLGSSKAIPSTEDLPERVLPVLSVALGRHNKALGVSPRVAPEHESIHLLCCSGLLILVCGTEACELEEASQNCLASLATFACEVKHREPSWH